MYIRNYFMEKLFCVVKNLAQNWKIFKPRIFFLKRIQCHLMYLKTLITDL